MNLQEVLGIFAGIIFLILGLTLLTRYRKLSSHKYFRILIIVVGLMLIGFAIYLGINSFYWNA